MKMKIDIDEIKKSGYTLEEVLAIIHIEMARVGQVLPYSGVKEEQILKMTKEGLLGMTPSGVLITETGRELILLVIGKKKPNIKKILKSDFNSFWEAFPVTDRHGIWLRTRSLRSDKTRSEEKYMLAIKNGVTHEDLMKALKWEVKDRMTNSTTNNRLSYMKASSTWLSQKEYEIILEEIEITPDNGEEKDWSTELI